MRSVTTGERGSYRISELPPGRYTVRVEMPAFSVVERQGVTLALGGGFIVSAVAAYGLSRKLGLLDPVPVDHA